MLVFTILQFFKSLKIRLVFVCHCPLLERRSEPLRSPRATAAVGGPRLSVKHFSVTKAYKHEGLDGHCLQENFFFPVTSNN